MTADDALQTEQFVMDEDSRAQADSLRALGLDPDTATREDLLAALHSRPDRDDA